MSLSERIDAQPRQSLKGCASIRSDRLMLNLVGRSGGHFASQLHERRAVFWRFRTSLEDGLVAAALMGQCNLETNASPP